MATGKRNFPRCYFMVNTKSRMFHLWATTEAEAFRTLYEMASYTDFPSSFEGLKYHIEETKIKLPTMVLKKILEKSMDEVNFDGIDFVSACTGRVLASSGHSKAISFYGCSFQPPAEEAFVEGMLSKADKNSGCIGLHFNETLPFSSDQILVRLIDGQALKDLSFFPDDSPYSTQVLDSLRNSLQFNLSLSILKILYHLMIMQSS